MKNKLTLFGKEIELSEETAKSIAEQLGIKNNEWDRKKGDKYYFVDNNNEISSYTDGGDPADNTLYESANYFPTRKHAEYVAKTQELYRKMYRFSMENGGEDIDYNSLSNKHNIQYSENHNDVVICTTIYLLNPFTVYFKCIKIAEKAMELFREEMVELYNLRMDIK